MVAVLAVGTGCEDGAPPPDAVVDPSRVVVQGGAACPDCRVEFPEVAVLGGAEDPASIGFDALTSACSVARISTGDWLVSRPVGGGQLLRYGPDGGFADVLGRPGEGPGEFGRSLSIQVGPGDTLHVRDDGNSRMTVLDADGTFVRSFPLPARFRRFARLGGGGYAFVRSPFDATTDMVVRTSWDGTILDEFERPDEEPPDADNVIVAPAHRSEDVWVGDAYGYRLERRASADSTVQVVTRDVPWFPPGLEFRDDMYEETPPPANLVDVFQRGDTLRVMVAVPGEDFAAGPFRQEPAFLHETFDTWVEFLDLASGRLIASHRHERFLTPMCDSPFVYTLLETDLGDTRVQILEPRVLVP